MFRQLWEPVSCTFTYLLADADCGEGLLVDPVRETAARDVALARDLGLTLRWGVNTHCHADHVTGTAEVRRLLRESDAAAPFQSVISRASGAKADRLVDDNEKITFGRFSLSVLSTPGHTDGCVSLFFDDANLVMTGDALLVRGCGRTDFQAGDSRLLYRSVHDRLFSLPPHTIVYPAHDYKGHTSSTVGEELRLNPRLGDGKTVDDFCAIMDGLKLPYPKQIDASLPLNMVCGVQESD